MKRKLVLIEYICNKCGHRWINKDYTKKILPRMCPSCKTVKWDDKLK